jgi:hypothetical protein
MVRHRGDLARGLVVTNHLARRGRRMGADLFGQLRANVPLDLVGMGAAELGGLGEVDHPQLPAFAAACPRALFHRPFRRRLGCGAAYRDELTARP